MSRVTRFAARDPGPSARVAGFLSHLRLNGLRLGVAESEVALAALTHVEAAKPDEARRALKAVCAGCARDAGRFDSLFDAFWLDAGRVRRKPAPDPPAKSALPHVRSTLDAAGENADGAGTADTPDGGEGEAESGGKGRLVASGVENLMRRDLREIVRPRDIAEAELVARRLGEALRDRRSRIRIAARKGRDLHFRRTIRRSLATGGEPLRLSLRRPPDRPRKIVALCDVSGSMSVYARVFLAFLAGLMRSDPATDAYLFHTRLARITDALRDRDALRAIGRLSLMADGFGGGSKIGECLDLFSRKHAKTFVDGRSVVMILSDGYDTAAPWMIGGALERLKKRGCRVIWLNPLKGWRGYAPVAAGMAGALPHLDLFAAANTLRDLACLEAELARL